MELLVIRHLPTKYNKSGLLQGRLNIDIDPPNQKQVLQIAENQRRIRQIGTINSVLCSSLNRTIQTALAYGYSDKYCVCEPLLDELDFGCYEGQPRQKMLDILGDVWWQSPESLVLGEPVLMLQNRIIQLLKKYAQNDRLLLFSHGAWTRALLSYIHTGNIRDMNHIIVDNNHMLSLTIA